MEQLRVHTVELKLCDKHKRMAREALVARGLEEWIQPEDGGDPKDLQFEPMMGVLRILLDWMVSTFGLTSLLDNAGQTVCPVCYAMERPCKCGEDDCACKDAPGVENHWITAPADEAYLTAKERGLLSSGRTR